MAVEAVVLMGEQNETLDHSLKNEVKRIPLSAQSDSTGAEDRPNSRLRARTGFFSALVWGIIVFAGCVNRPQLPDDPAQREMLSLLMPSRIEIVEPFTRVKSFDNDATPDGIELLLRAINSLDNPGLMIAGRVQVELFEFVPASGEKLGKRLEHWEIDLTTAKRQRAHWNSLTQMYEFRLGIDPTRISPSDKYVLVVTYLSPLGQRLTDDFVISSKAASAPLRKGRRRR